MKQQHTVDSFITHLFNLFNKQADDVRDVYQITSGLARHICATDVVSGEFDHMRKFIELYRDLPDDPDGVTVENKIPADIIIDNTIPIQTLEIGIDESTHDYNKATVFIDEGIRDLTIDDCDDLKDDSLSTIIVGVVQITDVWVFPIGISYVPDEGAYFVHIMNIPVNIKIPYGQYVKIIKAWSPCLMLELSDMVNTAVTLLNIWYGIQISLLHPVTKTVFEHAPAIRHRTHRFCPFLIKKRNRPARRPVIGRADNNSCPGAGGMNDLSAADINRHMVNGIAAGIKQQISRLNRFYGNLPSV